jgi:hypothetical protein
MSTNSRNRKNYRAELQKAGFSLENQPAKAVTSTATPVTHKDPGLGAKTISHPFKSKPNI